MKTVVLSAAASIVAATISATAQNAVPGSFIVPLLSGAMHDYSKNAIH